MADEDFRNNHYVPVWYQKRFIPQAVRDRELHYLDLRAGTFTDGRGVVHPRRSVRRLGPKFCFCERDLYTIFGATVSTHLEQLFFGAVDSKGLAAVDYWSKFTHPSVDYDALPGLLTFMTVQKFRTPKGLGWLREQLKATSSEHVLNSIVRLQQLYSATWSECVWLIADASHSPTKFIVSDHPVTVYNRRCGPRSQWCRGFNDPDVRYHASHTVYPLSMEKVLILTNLSWVRNPYQSEVGMRPNPKFFRGTVFNYTTVQTQRYLSEHEVREINFIIKSRAFRYIAAGNPEWLHPERYVSKSQWAEFGGGYLLMPDPRGMGFGGEVIIGRSKGPAEFYDSYGRRPWQRGYGKDSGDRIEYAAQKKFQGEFAHMCGPVRRGRTFEFGRQEKERDSDELHAYYLSLFKPKRR